MAAAAAAGQRWTEPADATRVGPVCPQPTDPRIPIDLGAPQGDDCLTLNVWCSSETRPGDGKPVMVWVHGGAYVLGSRRQPLYDGRALAARRRRGHRDASTIGSGAFGFLDLSGVQHDAERHSTPTSACATCCSHCGGCATTSRRSVAHADRVTLFGESAGAGIVTTLLASPAAAGLFSAAIAQSSPATSVYDSSRSRTVAETVPRGPRAWRRTTPTG